jgi:menaquinone-dependent protoporphyrinogen oxidase
MKVLVAYASRHGATRGIAERIGETLERGGHSVDVRPAEADMPVEGYDAFVIGSAAYMGRWLQPARQFVARHVPVLSEHPVWLFSSGPIGTDTVDAKGRDVVKASEPFEFGDFGAAVRPREMRVFYGAYDPEREPIGFAERFGSIFMKMPAVRDAMPAGDFRDWPAIEAWADGIARELTRADLPVALPA